MKSSHCDPVPAFGVLDDFDFEDFVDVVPFVEPVVLFDDLLGKIGPI